MAVDIHVEQYKLCLYLLKRRHDDEKSPLRASHLP